MGFMLMVLMMGGLAMAAPALLSTGEDDQDDAPETPEDETPETGVGDLLDGLTGDATDDPGDGADEVDEETGTAADVVMTGTDAADMLTWDSTDHEDGESVSMTGGAGGDHFVFLDFGNFDGTGTAIDDAEVTDFDPAEDVLVIGFDHALLEDVTFENEALTLRYAAEAHDEGGTPEPNEAVIRLPGVTAFDPSNLLIRDPATGEDMELELADDPQVTAADGTYVLTGAGDDNVTQDGSRGAVSLGAGDDRYSNDSAVVAVAGGDGDDFFSSGEDAAPEGNAQDRPFHEEHEGSVYYGEGGNDSFVVSGNGVTAFGGAGDDSFAGMRGSGAAAFWGGEGADTYEVVMGQTVWDGDASGSVTLTVWPEDLGDDPALIQSQAPLTVNLPAEVTGPLSLQPSAFGARFDLVTEAGDVLAILSDVYVDEAPDGYHLSDLVTVNRAA